MPVAVILAAILLVAVGCGGGDGNEGDETSAAEDVAVTTESVDTGATDPDSVADCLVTAGLTVTGRNETEVVGGAGESYEVEEIEVDLGDGSAVAIYLFDTEEDAVAWSDDPADSSVKASGRSGPEQIGNTAFGFTDGEDSEKDDLVRGCLVVG